MKITLAALWAVCFVAASAHEIRRDNLALETPIDAESKAIGTEAVLVGQVLRYVARDLEHDKALDNQVNEYFFRKLFGKIKEGVKKAAQAVGQGMKVVHKKILKPTEKFIQKVLGASTFSMEENVIEKATKIATKIVDKSAATYTLQDSQKDEDLVKQVCSRIDSTGIRLIEQGQQLLGLYDIDS